MDKIKLYTFPYAGGNANSFRPWKRKLSCFIELYPVELAGRGARMFDPLPDSIDKVVQDIKKLFEDDISDYVLFGHSMGTIIIHELLQYINQEKVKPPLHVFFSGRQAPHVKTNNEKIFHQMDENTFRNEILRLGGTPEEIFNDPELAQLFLPVLKNDFMICETYKPKKNENKCDIDFSVLAGTDENFNYSDLSAYSDFTTGHVAIKHFAGGHFFIKDSEDDVIEYINKTLSGYKK